MEDTKKSKFNAGVALTERIDSLHRAITSAKFNPLARNMETGTLNYEVLITCIDSMISEGWGKFSSAEKASVLRMQKILNDLVKYYPPVKYNKNGEASINKDNYNKFYEFYCFFERKLRQLYDDHNLGSPSIDMDDEDDY